MLREALLAGLPPDAIVIDPDVLAAYSTDRAPWAGAGAPAALTFPATTNEVQHCVLSARELGVPLVVRGAGSGLSGGANAVDGCLILCTSRMDQVLEIDGANQLAVVQPGVVTGDLVAAVAELGLWYPPDPASVEFCSIGGNVATNAGGLCCVKYGVTSDYVLGLEVVLADGSIVRTGRRTVKGVAGYDLTSLFVGSEGTLGVVTEVTVRLRPARPSPATLVAVFPSLESVGRAIGLVTRSGPPPALLELMDRTTVRAVEDWKPMDLDTDAGALLLAQSDLGGAAGEEQVALFERLCTQTGASFAYATSDPQEGAALLAARRLAYPALERLGATLLDDVAVPLSVIPDLITATARIADDHGVTIGTFGHAGDGNLHPTVVYDAHDSESERHARAAFGEVVEAALQLGGTITGEHGVGLLKRAWLPQELGEPALAAHRLIKRALDPEGLFNPGKLFDLDNVSS